MLVVAHLATLTMRGSHDDKGSDSLVHDNGGGLVGHCCGCIGRPFGVLEIRQHQWRLRSRKGEQEVDSAAWVSMDDYDVKVWVQLSGALSRALSGQHRAAAVHRRLVINLPANLLLLWWGPSERTTGLARARKEGQRKS